MNEHIFKPKMSRESIDSTIDHMRSVGGAHFVPILEAIRDHGIALIHVLQDGCRFSFPSNKSTIVLFGDDLGEAKGPPASHRKSVREVIDKSSGAVIISCEAQEQFYALVATYAAILRPHILIVETLPHFEADWFNLIQKFRPELPILLCSVTPEGGVQ